MRRLFTPHTPADIRACDADENSSATNESKRESVGKPTDTQSSLPTASVPPTLSPSKPSSRQNDPNHPLFPRGEQHDSGWHYLPQIEFFCRANFDAEQEFEVVGKIIAKMLDSFGYASYSVVLTHVGYSFRSLVPVIICIAKDFTIVDAESIQRAFYEFDRNSLHEVFCYEGSTSPSVHQDDFKRSKEAPDCGYSIGPSEVIGGANPDGSSSLGVYFRVKGNQTDLFATSVHHGLGKDVSPVGINDYPRIPIQQPSRTDLSWLKDELEEGYKLAIDPTPRRFRPNPKHYLDQLQHLGGLNTDFGQVVASEYKVIEYEQHKVCSDWIAIKVLSHRQGRNYIEGNFAKPALFSETWTPRDDYGLFIKGIGEICPTIPVRKSGRSTGFTTAKIECAYSFTRLEDSPCETREYCVAISPTREGFAKKGDSGAPVVNDGGEVVGFVLGGTDGTPMMLKGHEELGPVCVTYVSSAQMVMQRIAEAFGKDVILQVEDYKTVPGIILAEEDQ